MKRLRAGRLLVNGFLVSLEVARLTGHVVALVTQVLPLLPLHPAFSSLPLLSAIQISSTELNLRYNEYPHDLKVQNKNQ